MATIAASNQQQYYTSAAAAAAAAASVSSHHHHPHHHHHHHHQTHGHYGAGNEAAGAMQPGGWSSAAHQAQQYQSSAASYQAHEQHQLGAYAQPVEQLYQSQAAVAAAAAAAAAMVQHQHQTQQTQHHAHHTQQQADARLADLQSASEMIGAHAPNHNQMASIAHSYTNEANLQQQTTVHQTNNSATTPTSGAEPTKSTKGASKLRRDLINTEISQLRDLLPLPASTRQRLSQLQLMALVLVYVRKSNYFCNGK